MDPSKALAEAARRIVDSIEELECRGVFVDCDSDAADLRAALRAWDDTSTLRQAERAHLDAIVALEDWRDEADAGAHDFDSTQHNLELAVGEALCKLLAARALAGDKEDG